MNDRLVVPRGWKLERQTITDEAGRHVSTLLILVDPTGRRWLYEEQTPIVVGEE